MQKGHSWSGIAHRHHLSPLWSLRDGLFVDHTGCLHRRGSVS